MSRSSFSLSVSAGANQRGVVLVVALVLLAIMALVGLNAMRSVSLEERMTGHTYDRSVSFQAAEAALREAEAMVALNKPVAGGACAAGVCPAPLSTATPRWLDPTFAGWQNAATVTSGSVSLTPQYFVEYLGNTFECEPGSPSTSTDCKRYRITARSNAGADRASVMVQSTYATD
ncbi:MAG TPA: pilus assembly protein [Hydrogenophaga sp.]|uniref:pilus assembly PilX family protein n=1 Tax=Hydrogenophaga sp. TaxID=1904254 RepID=UPI002B63D537|nr:pilus assembly protein [Hydrogenophaga sp.]HSX95640.1 pilus assembly protein [Hydrogenophaga sp.]